MRLRLSAMALVAGGLVLGLAPLAAVAAPDTDAAARAPVQLALSYDEALHLQLQNSALIAGRDEHLVAARHGVQAVRHAGGPTVSLSANWLRYQKTLSLDLAGAREQAQDRIGDYLDELPGQFPSALQAGASAASEHLGTALPDLLPDRLGIRTRSSVFRPSVTAVWPLYTGGTPQALRASAQARVDLAQAQRDGAASLAELDLGQAYFGQQVADQLLLTSQQQLESMELHLHNAQRLEAHGVLPHSRVLEMGVARDLAQRNLERARLQQDNARAELARVLGVPDPIQATTPLFVRSQPLPPLQEYLDSGLQGRAEVQAAQAAGAVAGAATDLARAALRPQAYAFGSYNFNHRHALPVDPDWMVGVGLRFTLLSGMDRSELVQAAQARQRAAEHALQGARDRIALEITRAWNQAELARKTFLSLESSLAAARENLRVQELGFREGVGRASDVVGAQSLLGQAEAQRVLSAYEYDLALAALLTASNRSHEFQRYMSRAEHRLSIAAVGGQS